VQAHRVHEPVHDEGCPGHVARVLEQADEQKQQADLRQKNHHRSHPGEHPVHQQAAEVAGGQHVGHPAAQPGHSGFERGHRQLRERENALEHQRHQRRENDKTQNPVRQHPIQTIARRLPHNDGFGDRCIVNRRHPGVPGFDRQRSPIESRRLQSTPGRNHEIAHSRPVKDGNGHQAFLVRENQPRRRARALGAVGEGLLGQESSQGRRLLLERIGQVREKGDRPRRDLAPMHGENPRSQGGHPLSRAGDRWKDRHAKLLLQLRRVDQMPVVAGHIHHVQRHQRRIAQLDDLSRAVKIPLEVRSVHHNHNQVRRRHVLHPVKENVPRNLLVQRLRTEAVGPRQIQNIDRRRGVDARQTPLLPLHSDPGVVAHFRAQSRQDIEQRRLPAVRIARENHQERDAARGRSLGRGWSEMTYDTAHGFEGDHGGEAASPELWAQMHGAPARQARRGQGEPRQAVQAALRSGGSGSTQMLSASPALRPKRTLQT